MNVGGFKKIGDLLTKNSPTILTGFGVAGIITTAIMAVKATPKAMELIEDERCDRRNSKGPNKDLTKKDIIKITWKCYLPATIVGMSTIGCIIGANSINLRRNAALAGLYSLSETALKEYKGKVVETIGKNKERQIRDDIAKDQIRDNPVNDKEIVLTGNGETLCYDALGGRYFKSDIEEIRKVLNELSRRLLSEMSISLNEVYSDLGLSSTKLGDMICFHVDDGLIEPEFSSQLTEKGVPCLVLNFVEEPRYCYKD
jgi:hypothetical protein